MNPPILIVGAGPIDLNLALSLARRGVPFRIIADVPGPGEHSRALAVQARTLEFHGQFGFADEVIAQGIVPESVHIREGGDHDAAHEVMTVSFKDLGDDISPIPSSGVRTRRSPWSRATSLRHLWGGKDGQFTKVSGGDELVVLAAEQRSCSHMDQDERMSPGSMP